MSTGSQMKTSEPAVTARRITISVVLGVAAAVLIAFWLMHVAVSHLFVTEGSAPPASFGPAIPEGATLLTSEKNCASGGCWMELNIDPPEGQSARQLAEDMGIESERCTLSPTLNLLSVCVASELGPASDWTNSRLLVSLRYWSPIGSAL